MPAAPIGDWKSGYADGLQAYYAAYQSDQSKMVVDFYQKWIKDGVTGLESAAPFAGSTATVTDTAFAPVDFTGASSAAAAAAILSTAWQSFMNALVWPVIPPSGPFLSILAIITSPTGVAAAYSTLLAGLTAELSTLPSPPDTAMATKAAAISTLFRTATLAAGIQISGLAPGAPPTPLVIPLSPIQ